MQYVTLDTNAWIYLSNGTEPAKGLEFIKNAVEEGSITLLIPSIIIDEWHVNKANAIKSGVIKNFNDVTEGLGKILKLLGISKYPKMDDSIIDAGEESFESSREKLFQSIASNFKKGRNMIEDAVVENIKLVEYLFGHPGSRVLNISNEVMLKAGRFAILKKAPFLKKNSYADAIILFSFIEYVERNFIIDGVFVTYNTDDFCVKKEGKFSLHPDLEPEFKRSYSVFYNASGEALSNIDTNINLDFLGLIREVAVESDMNEVVEIAASETCERCFHEIEFKIANLDDDRNIADKSTNQLAFSFIKELAKSKFHDSLTRITIGSCSYCETDYFFCASCGVLNIVEDNDYDGRKECIGFYCHLPYYIRSEFNRWDYNQQIYFDKYTILAARKKCQSCGVEILNDGSDNNICVVCEDDYYYGGISGIN